MNEEKIDVMRPKLCGHAEPKYKKLRRLVKKCLHLRRKDEDWGFNSQLCTVVAWTGALVVTAVVVRSLYLMYIKPDTT